MRLREIARPAFILTAIVFVAGGPLARALDPTRRSDQYLYNEWNTSDGIPYTAVRELFQDSVGYIWVITRGGLARFDGHSFTAFTQANTPALVDDEIFTVAEDAGGTLWVATARGIVCHRDGRWWLPPALQQLPARDVRWLCRDGDGMLIGMRDAVHRFAAGAVTAVELPAHATFTALRSIRRSAAGDWIIVAQPSWHIRGKEAVILSDETGLPLEEAYGAVAEPDGSWWIAAEGGLYQLRDGVVTLHRTLDGRALPSARSLLLDRDRNLWIGTRGELLRHTAGRITAVERPGIDSVSNFLCLLEDREGNLWGGNDRGLVRLSDTKVGTLSRRDGLRAPSVVSALTARDGTVWLTVWGGGISTLSPAGTVERTYTTADGLISDTVWNIAEAPDGTFWFGYYNHGLARLRDGRFTHLPGLAQMKPRLRDMKVDHDGTVWLSSFTGGLLRVVGDAIQPFEVPGVPQTHALLVDRSGRLWLSWSGGIGRLDMSSGRWLERHDGGSESRPDAVAMMEDEAGDIWVARDETTIQRLHRGTLQTFELPKWVGRLTYSGVIHRGAVWINFRNGILRAGISAFDRAAATGEPVAFEFLREHDGMRSVAPNVFAGQGATVARDGQIYFATSSGVAIVDPGRIRRQVEPPRVVIERVIIDKESHHPGELAGLRPGRGEVLIHYTALGLTNAQINTFKYRLHPIEREWIEAGHERTAYYGGLPPGDYRFEVIAANADGVWNRTGAALTFRLPPHLHQTWWFYTIVALALPLAIWLYVRRHEASLRRDKQRLEDGIATRTLELHESNRKLQLQVEETARKATALQEREERIRRLNEDLESRVKARTAELEAANHELESFTYSVSHDLRAPLRGIDGWSLAILEDFGNSLDPEAVRHLTRVRTETQRLGVLIDDLLKLSRTTRSEFHPVDVDISELALNTSRRVAATRRDDRVTFLCQPGLHTRGDPNLLEAALFNLMDNAWKFSARTDAPQVAFGQAETERGRAFFVRDNGAGFDPRHARRLFGVFERMHTQEEFPGTGVGLATVQRIVARHGGQIWADAAPGRGATFYFTLPAGSAPPADNGPASTTTPGTAGPAGQPDAQPGCIP